MTNTLQTLSFDRIISLIFGRRPSGASVQGVSVWRNRYQSRRALSRLDTHLLRDIGLTEDMANLETAKPFWRD